jgi:hypothetical protein
LISKATISKFQANALELEEKNRSQHQEIQRLAQLLSESHEREKSAREAASCQRFRMGEIIATLKANIVNLEHSMTKASIEAGKTAYEKMGTLELDIVKQKLISKSLHEQVDCLNRRQELERKKIKRLLKNQAAICVGHQENASRLALENRQLKKYFEIAASSA